MLQHALNHYNRNILHQQTKQAPHSQFLLKKFEFFPEMLRGGLHYTPQCVRFFFFFLKFMSFSALGYIFLSVIIYLLVPVLSKTIIFFGNLVHRHLLLYRRLSPVVLLLQLVLLVIGLVLLSYLNLYQLLRKLNFSLKILQLSFHTAVQSLQRTLLPWRKIIQTDDSSENNSSLNTDTESSLEMLGRGVPIYHLLNRK